MATSASQASTFVFAAHFVQILVSDLSSKHDRSCDLIQQPPPTIASPFQKMLNVIAIVGATNRDFKQRLDGRVRFHRYVTSQ